MCDKELLVGYLYDELDGVDRRAFEAHLATCVDCRGEVEGLRATRARVAAWAPPAPDLGLRVVRGGAAPSAAPRARSLPAWGLAAAAALVLAASAAIANIEVRYDGTGLTVRTGWGRSPSAPIAAAAVPAAVPDVDLAALNQRLSELESVFARAPEPQAAAAEGRLSDAELLRRVRDLIGEAETRQQREMALVLAQVVRDFDRQRKTDIAMFQQGLGQYQGVTNAEIAQQRDMLNQFFRVATRQEK